MSQAQTAPTEPEGEIVEKQISLPLFVKGLLTVFGLRDAVGERADNGIYLNIFDQRSGKPRYDLTLQRKCGNSHFPVVTLALYVNDDRYTLTNPTNRLPRRTRNKLCGFLSGRSPAIITRDQALIAAYTILEYASRHARQ